MKKFLQFRGFGAFSLLLLLSANVGSAQEAPAPPPAQPPAAREKKKSGKDSHANDFLLKGTVFTDRALALPGAELLLRRSNEKKFRWETQTNSRGEFAIRVPQGSDYEVVARAKGFAEQTRSLAAKSGAREENMIFRMEVAPKGKKGGTR